MVFQGNYDKQKFLIRSMTFKQHYESNNRDESHLATVFLSSQVFLQVSGQQWTCSVIKFKSAKYTKLLASFDTD